MYTVCIRYNGMSLIEEVEKINAKNAFDAAASIASQHQDYFLNGDSNRATIKVVSPDGSEHYFTTEIQVSVTEISSDDF